MIKYLGSKRLLIPTILEIIQSLPDARSVIDLFAGTSRVGHALKRAGQRVLSNDILAYAHALAACYVETDRSAVAPRIGELLEHLGSLPGRPGYFTEHFCVRSRFFQPHNGARVDAIREEIERLNLEPHLRAVAIVSLMEAADRVDSTTGVQMAYLKQWAPRSFNDLELRVPDLVDAGANGASKAFCLDAREAAKQLEADVAYIDPPYNQHSYLGNYHIWETLVRWDKPDVYGIVCKRVDCRERRSDFNSKRRHAEAFAEVVRSVRARCLVVSFSNEGYVTRADMEALLATRGNVHVIERDNSRYVGAQIGIHNPQGELVGKVSHLRNFEYIFVVTPHDARWSPVRSVDAERPGQLAL